MNWQQIFKRTANIIGATLFVTLILWKWLPRFGYQLYYPDYQPYPGSGAVGAFNDFFISSIGLIIAGNLVIMYAEHRAKFWNWIAHALPVLGFCWLIGFALSYLLLELSFSNYTRLTLILFIGGLVFVIPGRYVYAVLLYSEKTWLARWLAPHNINLTGLQPEQVIKAMGEPINIINLETKTIFVYKRIKIIFSDGQVIGVQ